MMFPRVSWCALLCSAARGAAPSIFAVSLVTLAGLWGVAAHAQSATLSGTVFDERGAVIPGADVAVSNAATGLQRGLLTDGEGHFTFPLLPPSTYTVRIESAGFAPMEIRDATLSVNDHVTYRIQLKVGGVGAYVLVEDALGAERAASVGTVMDGEQVADLPLNGRGLHTLFELAPGTVPTRASFNEQGQFSVNGQRANANYFTVDGVSANVGVSAGRAPGQAATGSLPSLTAFGGTGNLVSIDALQELSIQTSSYAPEFGRLPGAQVTLVTRSGTNEFHGTAFEYFRHDHLSAQDWFASSRGLSKPHLRQSNFGGTLGGPLVRDRAFFFFSYEGLRLGQPQVGITEVPSNGLREFIAPAALRPFLNAFPRPNGFTLTGRRVGLLEGRSGIEEFSASYSDPARMDAVGLRLDANASDELFLFARYSRAPSETVQRGRGYVLGTSGQSLSTLSRTSFKTESLTVGATWAASSHISDDARVNWSRAKGTTSFTLDDFGSAVPLRVEQFAPPSSTHDAGLEFLILGGVNTSLALGKNADNSQRQFNVVNQLSVAASSHALKFGVDYRRLTPVYDPAGYTQQVSFPASQNINDNPALRAGRASLVTIFADTVARSPVFVNFSAFAQDVWRPTTRLTLTYGARWEVSPPPAEKSGNSPLHAVGTEDLSAFGLAPPGAPLWRTGYGNIAPRLGVAYRLHGGAGTVLRAGGGLYYDAGGGQSAQVFGSVEPYASIRRITQVQYPLDPSQAAPPTPNAGPPYDIVYAFAPDLKLPYSLQWNVTVEQPLGARQSLSASYVAAAGRRLMRQGVVAAAFPFREVRVVTNTATSDYHAAQVQFQRRLSRGLQVLASHTWSHSIDNTSEDSDVNASALNLALPPERSASNFDVRHSTTGAVTYDLGPLGRGRLSGALLGDLSADAIFRARTATPVNVYFGRTLLSGETFGLIAPDVIHGRPFYVEDAAVAGGRRINREAFAAPGSTGHALPRNALRGFGMWQVDLSLGRRFTLSERAVLQLKAELFNVFNHPNFGNPVADLNSGLFGQSVQTLGSSLGAGGVNGGLLPVYQAGGPRSLQLAVKLQF